MGERELLTVALEYLHRTGHASRFYGDLEPEDADTCRALVPHLDEFEDFDADPFLITNDMLDDTDEGPDALDGIGFIEPEEID